MTRRHYEVGQVVFAEGEESEFVGYISEGEAEVSRRHGDDVVVIGFLKAGEYFGEMSAIEGGAHEATVRAVGDLTVDCIPKSEFLDHASHDSGLAFCLLERLSQRLHRLDDAYAAAVSTNRNISARLKDNPPAMASTDSGPVASVRLLAGSKRVAAFLPVEGLVLDRFPFVVGRTPSIHEHAPRRTVDLLVDDAVPYRLSRLHFELVIHDGCVHLHDLNSHLGTVVNGTFIGRFFPRDSIALNSGENSIVAGGEGSPYVFRAVLGE